MELTVQGRSVFAATGGKSFDPTLPAAIFVHGAGLDHTVWALQTRYFANHGRSVLAIDLPGHGRSSGPALDSIDAVGEWLVELMAVSGAERVALIGHSLGAIACLEAAAIAPRRGMGVDKLALLGAAACMPVHPDLIAAARIGDGRAHAMIVGWGVGRRAQIGGHRAPGLWLTGGSLQLLARSTPQGLATDLVACNAYQRGADAAREIKCPTLVLIGAADRMTPPKSARELASYLADARAVELPGAGHMMMLEQPEKTLDALASFL
ncbi:MAG: alpha/beta hydrolase [Alphaproteobacteria bacterium]|nr:alpha/beta hydrolase [Alphaproteobacteria bacterium]